MTRNKFLASLGALIIAPFLPNVKKKIPIEWKHDATPFPQSVQSFGRETLHNLPYNTTEVYDCDEERFTEVGGLGREIPIQEPWVGGTAEWQRDWKGRLYITKLEMPDKWWADKERYAHHMKFLAEQGIYPYQKDEYLKESLRWRR